MALTKVSPFQDTISRIISFTLRTLLNRPTDCPIGTAQQLTSPSIAAFDQSPRKEAGISEADSRLSLTNGVRSARDWTLGCIALEREHGIEVHDQTREGTPVIVRR